MLTPNRQLYYAVLKQNLFSSSNLIWSHLFQKDPGNRLSLFIDAAKPT